MPDVASHHDHQNPSCSCGVKGGARRRALLTLFVLGQALGWLLALVACQPGECPMERLRRASLDGDECPEALDALAQLEIEGWLLEVGASGDVPAAPLARARALLSYGVSGAILAPPAHLQREPLRPEPLLRLAPKQSPPTTS